MTEIRMRDYVMSVLRYSAGISILWWVIQQADWSNIGQLLNEATAQTLGVLFVITIIGLVTRFYTWKTLFSSFDNISLANAARIDLTTNFVNQLLPSRISGRLVAPIVITRITRLSFGEAVGISGMHTGLFAVAYGIVGLYGVFLTIGHLPPAISLLTFGTTALYLTVGLAIVGAGSRMRAFESALNVLLSALASIPVVGNRLSDVIPDIPRFTTVSGETFKKIGTNWKIILKFIISWVISLAITGALRVWLLFEILDIAGLPLHILPFVIVAAYSVTILPLTPGGIGVTETTATIIFVGLGVPATVAAPAVLADRFLGVYLPALFGWYPTVRLDVRELMTD